MKCSSCGDNGYVENWVGGGGAWTASLEQCPKRCDITKYSSEVQKRLSKSHVTERQPIGVALTAQSFAKILPFKRRADLH